MYYLCIEKNANSNKEKIGLIFNEKEYSYQELKKEILKQEEFYLKAGVKENDRVIILGDNSDIFIIQLFTCLKIGAIFIPLSASTTEERINYIIKDSSAKYIFFVKKKELCSTDVIVDERINNSIPSKMGCIIYTSGSTSMPKGVLESKESMTYVTKQINTVIGNGKDDRVLDALPLSFDYGLYQIFLTFSVGATLVLLKNFGIMQTLPSVIEKYQITGLPLVPTAMKLLLKCRRMSKENMRTVKYITSTGDTLPVRTIEEIHCVLPHIDIFPMYGLTECKRAFIMPRGRWDKIFAGSCGIPMEGEIAEIVNRKGEKLSSFEKGELIIYGNNVMEGYWNDDEATEKKFVLKNNTKGVKTGDIFSTDEEGFYYFHGRKEFYLKSRGIKISPLEIEKIVMRNENIDECVVLGIENEIEGDRIAVYLSLKEDDKESKMEIMKYINEIPMQMRPKIIGIADKGIPLNSNGKYDRKKIKKILVEMQNEIYK